MHWRTFIHQLAETLFKTYTCRWVISHFPPLFSKYNTMRFNRRIYTLYAFRNSLEHDRSAYTCILTIDCSFKVFITRSVIGQHIQIKALVYFFFNQSITREPIKSHYTITSLWSKKTTEYVYRGIMSPNIRARGTKLFLTGVLQSLWPLPLT